MLYLIEAGKECTVREGTELWTYGLTLNYLPKQKWFNIKRDLSKWFNVKLPARKGLTLNHSPNCTKKSKTPGLPPWGWTSRCNLLIYNKDLIFSWKTKTYMANLLRRITSWKQTIIKNPTTSNTYKLKLNHLLSHCFYTKIKNSMITNTCTL